MPFHATSFIVFSKSLVRQWWLEIAIVLFLIWLRAVFHFALQPNVVLRGSRAEVMLRSFVTFTKVNKAESFVRLVTATQAHCSAIQRLVICRYLLRRPEKASSRRQMSFKISQNLKASTALKLKDDICGWFYVQVEYVQCNAIKYKITYYFYHDIAIFSALFR